MGIVSPGDKVKVSKNIGRYQVRIDPKYKDKLAVIEGIRKMEGATEASKYSVTEEAIDLYYSLLHEKHGLEVNV